MKQLKFLTSSFKAEQLKTNNLEEIMKEKTSLISQLEVHLEKTTQNIKDLTLEKDQLQVRDHMQFYEVLMIVLQG